MINFQFYKKKFIFCNFIFVCQRCDTCLPIIFKNKYIIVFQFFVSLLKFQSKKLLKSVILLMILLYDTINDITKLLIK